MLKDVIREYDEHFPEIIERATYTLEKVGGRRDGEKSVEQKRRQGSLGGPVLLRPAPEALPSFSTWKLPLHTELPWVPLPHAL